MAVYGRKRDTAIWHWCRVCSSAPAGDLLRCSYYHSHEVCEMVATRGL